MQNLDVISINLWQILISLCNLVLLFLILKKFLYRPVVRVMQERAAELEQQYAGAEEMRRQAADDRAAWEEKLQNAEVSAQHIRKQAETQAEHRGEQIVADAKERADFIVREAQTQAELTHRKAQSEIKQEIAEVSAEIAAKLIQREMREEDHRNFIHAALAEIGDIDDGNQ